MPRRRNFRPIFFFFFLFPLFPLFSRLALDSRRQDARTLGVSMGYVIYRSARALRVILGNDYPRMNAHRRSVPDEIVSTMRSFRIECTVVRFRYRA